MVPAGDGLVPPPLEGPAQREGELAGPAAAPGTPLPDFMVDDVLGCREGYVPEDFDHDQGVNRIFNLRTAPISAAIVIDIDLP